MGTHPERAILGLQDHVHPIRTQRSGIVRIVPVASEYLDRWIEPIQTLVGAHPEHTVLVFIQGTDESEGNRGAVFRVVPKSLELVTVVADESAGTPQPEETLSVLHNRIVIVVRRQPIGLGEMLKLEVLRLERCGVTHAE